ncbi:ABC transporter ATP-binding protein [Actinopolymorpha singaporensis]
MEQPDRPVLETEGLVKRYGGLTAVDGIDLSVGAGTVCGLLGRNGAGKSTLLRMILGLLTPDAGVVRLFGREVSPQDTSARERVAGFVEDPRFYPYLSALGNLELLSRLDRAGSTRAPADALELVGLADRAGERVRGFSTGMRQQLGIAAALIRSPDLLILDEPTIGLDPTSATSVRSLVRQLADCGRTVLLSSHNMTEVAEICDEVVIIDTGAVVWQGSLERLREQAPVAAYRLSTTDDAAARRIGRELRIDIDDMSSGGLLVHAGDASRNSFAIELGRQGVAIRQLEPDIAPLESLFASLTGDPALGARGLPVAGASPSPSTTCARSPSRGDKAHP